MDVRCEKCGTEYELDESKLRPSGVTVKCTSCGHMFKVRRRVGAEGEARSPGVRTWLVRLESGEIRACSELTTLQTWITSGEISAECEISRTGKKWKRLGDIAELATFFAKQRAPTPTHPRTVRRDGASKTARLPKPMTGSHGVPSVRPAPAAKRTLHGAAPPSQVLRSRAPTPLESASPVAEEPPSTGQETVPHPRLPAKGAPWFVPANTEEKTIEVNRAPPVHAETDKMVRQPFDVAEDEPTREHRSFREEPVTQDLAEDDLEETIDAAEEPELTASDLADPSTFRHDGKRPLPIQIDGSQGQKTGSWATTEQLRKSLRESEGPSGPTGGLMRPSSESDVAFVESKLRALEEDESSDIHSSSAGKWIVIGSLALLGAAAGVVFFVLSKRGDGAQVASTANDQPATAEVAQVDASVAETPPKKPPPEEPWMAAVAGATTALTHDAEPELEAALEALTSAGDKRLEVVLARGQVEAALAQKTLDSAAFAEKSQEARNLVKESRKRAERAAADAKTARELAPENSDVLALSADAVRLTGGSSRAVDRWVRKATATAPDGRYVGYVQAMALLGAGDKKKARALLEKQLDDAVPDTRQRYRLALLDFQDAAYEKAKAGAEAVLAIANQHAGAKRLLDEVTKKTAVSQADPLPPRDDNGSSSRDSGSEPSGGSYDQLVERADRKAENGDCRSATKLYQQALDENPAGVAALTGLGYCHIDAHQFAQAQSKFRAALGVSPRFQPALYGIAEAYQQQGLTAKAIEAYKEYLENHPNGSRAQMAKRQIDRLGGGTGGSDTPDSGSGKADAGVGQPADKPPTDKPPTDKPPTDKPPTDKPPTDSPPTDKPPTDSPPTGEQPAPGGGDAKPPAGDSKPPPPPPEPPKPTPDGE